MIELRGLGMSYTLETGPLTVLDGVNARIEAGETVAVIGPSGSGKTTLLLLLAGLERPRDGSIHLDGTDLGRLDRDALADLRRDSLGIIFQSFHLVPSLTALGNVALPLEIAGLPEARRRAAELLDRVGLAGRRDHYPSQLSGGEQQRVAIARALIHSPKLVLADEPTGNLDLATGATIIDMLFELHDKTDSTLVLVTHDDAVAERCERTLRLTDGRLVEDDRNAISR